MQKTETKNVGPIVGTLIIIIVIIVAALYVFASHINRQALINSDTASSTITVQSGGDDVQSLKNDLNNAIK